MHIVYLLGVDGSGKTTLGKRLAQGLSGQYVYCGSGTGLRSKLRTFSRKRILKEKNLFQSHEHYETVREKVRKEKPTMLRLYACFQYANLFYVSWTKLLAARMRGNIAILDRYSFDAAVSVACLLRHPSSRMLRHAKILEWILPKPDLILFLDIDEETACSRKRDVPAPEFLREKISRYQDLLNFYRWKTIDSKQPANEVYSQALATISNSFARTDGPETHQSV